MFPQRPPEGSSQCELWVSSGSDRALGSTSWWLQGDGQGSHGAPEEGSGLSRGTPQNLLFWPRLRLWQGFGGSPELWWSRRRHFSLCHCLGCFCAVGVRTVSINTRVATCTANAPAHGDGSYSPLLSVIIPGEDLELPGLSNFSRIWNSGIWMHLPHFKWYIINNCFN